MNINQTTPEYVANKDLLLEITAGACVRIKIIPEVDRRNI